MLGDLHTTDEAVLEDEYPAVSPTDANRARARAAAALIRGYSIHKTSTAAEPLDPDDLRDVLADAMHLCQREGWDVAEMLDDARWNYEREVAEAARIPQSPDTAIAQKDHR